MTPRAVIGTAAARADEMLARDLRALHHAVGEAPIADRVPRGLRKRIAERALEVLQGIGRVDVLEDVERAIDAHRPTEPQAPETRS